jgi:uncharacterized membrane protein
MKVNLNRDELALMAILFIGLFLRVYDLSGESIWFDEAFSIELANSGLFGVLEESAQDIHPPLYNVLLHYWIVLFGDSEFSTRFMSVIFGVFAIFMIYKVGSLIFDEEVGIFGALLLALSNFHIYYSQESRMYSLMALLTLLSMYFFLKILSNRNVIDAVAYVLCSIFLVYTHYFGLFIIIAQNIYIFTLFLLTKDDYKRNMKRWILLQLILIVLFSPWIVVFIRQVLQVQNGYRVAWIPVPSIHSIIKSFSLYSGSNLLLYLFLILAFFSIVPYKKLYSSVNCKDSFRSLESHAGEVCLSNIERSYLLLVWLLTPIVLPFIISKVSAPIYWYRNTIVASLAFYLLVAAGIRRIEHNYLKLAIIGVVIFGSLAGAWSFYSTVNKERWREVVSYIDTNAKQGDLLLFNAGYTQEPFDYYSKRTDLIKRPFPENTTYVDEDNIKKLGSTVRGYNRVWVILAHSGDSNDLIKKKLSESYNSSFHKEYVSMTYDKYHNSLQVNLFEKD